MGAEHMPQTNILSSNHRIRRFKGSMGQRCRLFSIYTSSGSRQSRVHLFGGVTAFSAVIPCAKWKRPIGCHKATRNVLVSFAKSRSSGFTANNRRVRRAENGACLNEVPEPKGVA